MMAYYKVRIEVWCDWDPAESDLEEIAENISAGEACCRRCAQSSLGGQRTKRLAARKPIG